MIKKSRKFSINTLIENKKYKYMFSWENAISRAKAHKLRQTKQIARTGNTDFKLKHPDEARDLTSDNPNDIKTKKRILEEFDKNAKLVKERENKYGGKN